MGNETKVVAPPPHPVYATIRKLSNWEAKRLQRFLTAATFLDRTDLAPWLVELRGALDKKPHRPDIKEVWKAVRPTVPFDAKRFRLQLSYLRRAIDDFHAMRRWSATPGLREEYLARHYAEAGDPTTAARYLRRASEQLERSELRNTDYLHRRYRIAATELANTPADTPPVAAITTTARHLDEYFIQSRLRQACQLLALQTVHHTEERLAFVADILRQIAADPTYLRQPAIAFYYHAYRALQSPTAEEHFRSLLALFETKGSLLETSAYQEVYTLLINYGIRKLNEGNTAYLPITFDLFRVGVEEKILWEGEELSQATYSNTFAAALKLGRMAWAEEFLLRYRSALPAAERESVYRFCLAQLRYEQGKLREAMELLVRYGGHGSHLQQLQGRITLLKIYFELREWEPAQSLLHAMSIYLNRNRKLGYHRAPYRAVVRWCRRLLAEMPLSAESKIGLREDLATILIPSLREWLAAQLERS